MYLLYLRLVLPTTPSTFPTWIIAVGLRQPPTAVICFESPGNRGEIWLLHFGGFIMAYRFRVEICATFT